MELPKTEQQSADENERETKETPAVVSPASEHAEKRSDAKGSEAKSSVKTKLKRKNNVRKLRMERMMSKAELARRAGLSSLTVDRVERGMTCRMDTKRKILEALGLTPSDRVTVFGDDD
jgi:DNA-binding XRE family transcriptional regulator